MMTTIAPPAAPETDQSIVEAFAYKTKGEGETPRVHSLWDNRFRINFWKDSKIVRSLFVVVSGGKVEFPSKT